MSTATLTATEPALRFIGGDKIIGTMVSREVMLGMLVMYLGMIGGLRVWMKNRKPFSLKLAMQVRSRLRSIPPRAQSAPSRTGSPLAFPPSRIRPCSPAFPLPCMREKILGAADETRSAGLRWASKRAPASPTWIRLGVRRAAAAVARGSHREHAARTGTCEDHTGREGSVTRSDGL